MKIFITGVAGFLGSHLADYFIKKGHIVSGCDDLSGGSRDNLHKKVIFWEQDCTDWEDMNMVLGKEKPDIVYHLAAHAHEGLSVFSPSLISKSVYQSTANMLSVSARHNVKKFVYASSMARYGSIKTPFYEHDRCKPQDPYGIAKYSAEFLVKNVCDTHGMDWSIAVPHNIIGTKQKYDDPFRNVVSIMINMMLQGKQPIIYGDGGQMRCFSFVQDCIYCLVQMATNDITSKQIINIGPDEEFISINDLAKKIAKLLKFKLKPIYMKDRPQEVRYATCNSDTARNWLDYKTKTTLDEGLEIMIKWIKEKGTKPFAYHLPIEIKNKLLPKAWRNRLL